MGPFVNSLNTVLSGGKSNKLATHVLQFTFNGFGGFRWPVAYFGTSTATAYEIYCLFWEAVDLLEQYGFTVDYCNVDGASTNRAFINLHFQDDMRTASYTTSNRYNPNHKIVFLQDIKHVLKKVRNSLYSSRLVNKTSGGRHLVLDGQSIVWDAWLEAEKYNREFGIRMHRKLTLDHVHLQNAAKMRNQLACDVLNKDMHTLMSEYSSFTKDSLQTTVNLIKHTANLVDIFHDKNRPITSLEDSRINDLKECLDFFNKWESSVLEDSTLSKKEKQMSLITQETRDDLNSSILGFISLCNILIPLKVPITPGLVNSDLIENMFCQQRGIRHGLNTNPTLQQYGPAVNAIILGQFTISKKCNSGDTANMYKSTGVYKKSKK